MHVGGLAKTPLQFLNTLNYGVYAPVNTIKITQTVVGSRKICLNGKFIILLSLKQ